MTHSNFLRAAMVVVVALSCAMNAAADDKADRAKLLREFSVAAALQNNKLYKLAAKSWKKFLAQTYDEKLAAPAWRYLAVCQTQLGEHEAAVESALKVGALFPKSPHRVEADLLAAANLLALKKKEAAEKLLASIEKEHPKLKDKVAAVREGKTLREPTRGANDAPASALPRPTSATIDRADTARQVSDENFNTLNRASLVFIATLDDVKAGPVARSFPPIYNYTLTFEEIDKPLRGAKPEGKTFQYNVRAREAPEFAVGKRYIVAAGKPDPKLDKPRIVQLQPATDKAVAEAQRAVSLPIGWSFEEGKPVSPWAQRREGVWPQKAEVKTDVVCAKSGRPALLAGDGIEIQIEQVPPQELRKFQNPYGDGQFKVTVNNTGRMAASVPALLQDGDRVAWEESLVIVHRDGPFLLPRTEPLTKPQPVQLAPGQSISTTVDLLLMDGIDWPRGGSRVRFTFCLGEKSADNFFYYYSRLHDDMRKKRREAAGL